MLLPDDLVLLTEALRPPEGYRVDVAVGTTYSLDITAMLLAPMTFAFHDVDDLQGDAAKHDPIELLNAVQRHIARTTVFCQAGAIHVPSQYSRIFTMVEDGIHEVTAPAENAIFHPKVWAVRYVGESDRARHRLLIASRNLTLDSSWDTLLVLDEQPDGAIDGSPAGEFVADLPSRSIQALPATRARDIEDLARTLSTVRFAPPAAYSSGRLLPLGLRGPTPWPLPAHADKVLAIGPFLTGSTLDTILAGSADSVLVSRPETLDRLAPKYLSRWDINVLSPRLDDQESESTVVVDEFVTAPTAHDQAGSGSSTDEEQTELSLPLSGLHAKVVVADLGDATSATLTGSANLTNAAWHRNVEFAAILFGDTDDCGVEATLHQQGEVAGLRSVLQPYTPRPGVAEKSPAEDTAWKIERFHQQLAQAGPRLDVVRGAGATVTARLDLDVPEDTQGSSEIWLITLPRQRRDLTTDLTWELAPENVTPFIAIRTTAGSGEAQVTRSCCIMAVVAGDVADRRQEAMASILSSPERMLRYLALLLGIDARIDPIAALDPEDSLSVPVPAEDAPRSASLPPIVLYEPLVRAAAASPGHLASIADQIAELRQLPDAARLIPPEFEQMWDAVLRTVGTRSTR